MERKTALKGSLMDYQYFTPNVKKSQLVNLKISCFLVFSLSILPNQIAVAAFSVYCIVVNTCLFEWCLVEVLEMDSDPHDDNPTDTLSAPELELVMHELLAAKDKNADWKNRGIVWSILSNIMIRWNSSLCLCLPNMFIHKKLPPHGIVQEHHCMPPTHL